MRKIMTAGILTVFIEIALFIIIGNIIGVMNTLFIIFLTSVLGLYIVTKKGAQSIQNVRNSFVDGIAPGAAMVDTLMIYLGGVLLITPGFLTDVIGILMLFSLTRKLFKPLVYMWIRRKMKSGNMIIVQRN